LCVATAGLWVRSYWVADSFVRESMASLEVNGSLRFIHESWRIQTVQGGVYYSHGWTEPFMANDMAPSQREWWEHDTPRVFAMPQRRGLRRWSLAGIVVAQFPHDQVRLWIRAGFDGEALRIVRVPYWLPTVAFVLLSAASVNWAMRRQRAQVPGLCAVCGYDLRATPDRCPECGNVPAKVKA
jgi:hypothetical protein